MAKVDYWGVKEELRVILDAAFDNVTIRIDEDMQFAMEETPWVCIYLEGREIPPEQSISAGRRVRVNVKLSVWVWVYGLDLKTADQERDRLIGEVELVLMGNRTLNDMVNGLLLEGGELPTKKDSGSPGFFSGGEVKISSDITAEVS